MKRAVSTAAAVRLARFAMRRPHPQAITTTTSQGKLRPTALAGTEKKAAKGQC
ncbi:MAG: hypothetical protein O7G30_11880 [Proteobacteria bacterium]|nr:hypothetical protein [Pseudomonadota bacterium]